MRKNAKKFIDLKCSVCGKEYRKELKEYNRCCKRGYSATCGRSCGISSGNKKSPRLTDHLIGLGGRKINTLSPFKYYLNKTRCKSRVSKYGQPNLTLEFLKSLWDNQNGICPYTKLKMELPESTRDSDIKANSPLKASLDRIDPSKGYVQGNVEFVCLAVNLAKSSFSKEQMLDFFFCPRSFVEVYNQSN